MFQSHIDSIKASCNVVWAWSERCFNPTLIRLRQEFATIRHCLSVCFNPTLIRLRHRPRLYARLSLHKFQSHIDSIKAVAGYTAKQLQASFNPTLIRLRQRMSAALYFMINSFNPTLIRLRQEGIQAANSDLNAFQSHIDSIKAIRLNLTKTLSSCFNPTLIRLRHLNVHFHQFAGHVSIPHWFD